MSRKSAIPKERFRRTHIFKRRLLESERVKQVSECRTAEMSVRGNKKTICRDYDNHESSFACSTHDTVLLRLLLGFGVVDGLSVLFIIEFLLGLVDFALAVYLPLFDVVLGECDGCWGASEHDDEFFW